MTDLTNNEVVKYAQADSLLVAAEMAIAQGDDQRFAEIIDQMMTTYITRGSLADAAFLVSFLTICTTVNGTKYCEAAGLDRSSYLESRALENLSLEVHPDVYHETHPDEQKE